MSRFVRIALSAVAAALACGALAVAAPAPKPEPGVLAVVGDVKITESELMSSLPADRQKAFEGAAKRINDIERQAMESVFAKRYVEQQAKAKGISEDAYYEQEIAANRDSFDADFKTQISQVKQQIYDAKKMALDDYIGKTLEEKAAKAKGVTVDALIKTEIEDKIAPVTPADVDTFYAQNQRMFGGQAKEAVTKQIEDQIRAQRIAQKRNDFRASLRASTPVKINLEVPRIAISIDDQPIQGSKDAPVMIVHFSDYQCPFCSRVVPTLDKIRKDYGDKVAVVYRDFPLSFHQYAEKASEAADCAGKQGKFWEYHDKNFANQGQLSVPDLKKRAEEMGLDMAKFNQCLDSGETKPEIDRDMKDGAAYGVQGTPATFVNGRFLSGAQPYENFKKVIDDELSLKGIPIPAAAAAPAAPAKG